MPIPDYQAFMLPVLKLCASRPNNEVSVRSIISEVIRDFQITDDEMQELLPSGGTTVSNRIGWAVTYMKKAGLLQATRRGHFRITDRGINVVAQKPSVINVRFLEQFPEFAEFRTKSRPDSREQESRKKDEGDSATPEEALDNEYQKIRANLASQLLERVKQMSPAFFEKLVIELLIKMGYGGSFQDAGKAVGRTRDGGIDGIIKEDRLGLDVIYIQAKRWDTNSVGRADIQQFAGALQGQRATKGIFLTTSTFTREAQDYVSKIGNKIVLIDGEQLSEMMIDHGVGVSTSKVYEIKRVVSDYFSEEI